MDTTTTLVGYRILPNIGYVPVVSFGKDVPVSIQDLMRALIMRKFLLRGVEDTPLVQCTTTEEGIDRVLALLKPLLNKNFLDFRVCDAFRGLYSGDRVGIVSSCSPHIDKMLIPYLSNYRHLFCAPLKEQVSPVNHWVWTKKHGTKEEVTLYVRDGKVYYNKQPVEVTKVEVDLSRSHTIIIHTSTHGILTKCDHKYTDMEYFVLNTAFFDVLELKELPIQPLYDVRIQFKDLAMYNIDRILAAYAACIDAGEDARKLFLERNLTQNYQPYEALLRSSLVQPTFNLFVTTYFQKKHESPQYQRYIKYGIEYADKHRYKTIQEYRAYLHNLEIRRIDMPVDVYERNKAHADAMKETIYQSKIDEMEKLLLVPSTSKRFRRRVGQKLYTIKKNGYITEEKYEEMNIRYEQWCKDGIDLVKTSTLDKLATPNPSSEKDFREYYDVIYYAYHKNFISKEEFDAHLDHYKLLLHKFENPFDGKSPQECIDHIFSLPAIYAQYSVHLVIMVCHIKDQMRVTREDEQFLFDYVTEQDCKVRAQELRYIFNRESVEAQHWRRYRLPLDTETCLLCEEKAVYYSKPCRHAHYCRSCFFYEACVHSNNSRCAFCGIRSHLVRHI